MRPLTELRVLALPCLVVLTVVACGTSSSPSAGSVRVVGVWSGPEQASFEAVVKPFENQTGIKVDYTSSSDLDAILRTSVAAGNPPDVAAAPSTALLTQFVQQGKVFALNGVVDITALHENYGQSWIDLGEPLRDGRLYQVYSWAAIKGLVWYDPRMFQAKSYNVPTTWQGLLDLQDEVKAGGVTPWCMGLHSAGVDDGWPAGDWLKEIVLSQSGPDVYDRWVAGTQKWTSPEIKLAFQTFGTILGPADSNIYGGKSLALSASYKTAGDPMFTNPPKCYLQNQVSLATSNPVLQATTDFNFFPLPDINGKFAGSHVVSGDAWSMFHDTPQARKLIQYLTTSDAQVIWVKRGGKLSPNTKTPLDAYADPLSRESAQILINTQIARHDATDSMPPVMRAAAWKALLDFVSNQNNLDKILAGLDKVQQTAYKAS
jgi:alpha-glucoside transport system substrate-binding protein